jgi:predicted secreted protein
MFRRHCRHIAEQICDQIQTYRDNDHQVLGIVLRDGSPTCGLKCSAVEADDEQVWGGIVWHASPLQHFGATEDVYTEELKAELQQRGMEDLLLFSLPEVPEAGSLPDALQEIRSAVRTRQD